MNLCDQICNQTTIYYSQGRYSRNWTSPNARSPKKPKRGKESTKEWVARAFSSEAAATAERDSASATASALANGNGSSENSSKNGKPAVFFQKSLVDSINDDKFKFCLVGKFPKWRPGLSQIRDWVSSKWKLKGEWSITLLDHRHVFIRLDNEADMLHVWSRNRWFVGGHPMRVFKWFSTFVPSKGEPSTAAIWVSFPSLPVAFFQEELLFPIASVAGKVFAMDGPTRNLSRTNLARVCVEVDLLKELPRQVWVGVGEEGFWQDICYHRLPSYCINCREQGHSSRACQAKRGDSQRESAKSNYGRESGGAKRVRICPILEDDAGGKQSMLLGSSQTSLWKDEDEETLQSSSVSSEETDDERKEATTHKGECSNAAHQSLSADNYSSEIMVNQETDVLRKSGSSVTEPKGEILGAEARTNLQIVSQSEENRESIARIMQKFPPTRLKRVNFLLRSRQKDSMPEALRLSLSHLEKFKYSEIKKMTNSFGDIIGKEGFSSVFKGKLPNGQEVAVKVRRTSSPEVEEFLKEIQVLSNTSHSNIIKLLGFCWEGSSRILVYEFMSGGSLAEITYPEERSTSAEQSKGFCEIAVGVARGLEYLHREFDPPILHLHINPLNILLDKDLRPKIKGLGRAHVSSDSDPTVSGTVGYNPPEFYRPWRVSSESDVYSYGITLLEMTLGKGGRNPQWVRRRVIGEGGIKEFAREETQRKMAIVGIWCTLYDPALRPSFSKVIEMLEGSANDLSLPSSFSSSS
ncbi:hypothetical protein H6P81_005162 [Aristolochia fimbriata]|uniref:Protein kinase domain-containing protein n=1 Tax=Aristolochia fimbriata TaxID=158543 RepID=A0AAV7ETU7_ARIFI|nr:hypothetical protein H6P81_005162 [Aristolochia fimbriata]